VATFNYGCERPWADGSSYNAPGASDRSIAGSSSITVPDSVSSLSLEAPVSRLSLGWITLCCATEPLIGATRFTTLAKVALTDGSETLMRSACEIGTPVGVMNLTNERFIAVAVRITSKLTLETISNCRK